MGGLPEIGLICLTVTSRPHGSGDARSVPVNDRRKGREDTRILLAGRAFRADTAGGDWVRGSV